MKWISVFDRDPIEGIKILMTYNKFVIIGRYFEGKFYCETFPQRYCDCEIQEGITHWMYLPEPPKE